MVENWLSTADEEVDAMSVTITLKNIPDAIYESLKAAAANHHRSLNSEVIACLEQVLHPSRISNDEHLERAARIRAELQGKKFKAADIRKFANEGRA